MIRVKISLQVFIQPDINRVAVEEDGILNSVKKICYNKKNLLSLQSQQTYNTPPYGKILSWHLCAI